MSAMQQACIQVMTRPQLRAMVDQIRDRDRIAAVVGLTSRAWEKEPAFRPEAVRTVIGAQAQLYSIPTGHLTKALAVKLGPRLAVCEGDARIWWPRACGPTAAEHPVVPAPSRAGDDNALEELARALRLSRPMTAAHVDMLEAERNEAIARSCRISHALARQERELAEARILLEAKQAMLIEAKAQLHSLRVAHPRSVVPRLNGLP